jgi:hypothetical protein
VLVHRHGLQRGKLLRANPFRGKWRIVSTSVWDKKELDDPGSAQITFGRIEWAS